MTAPRESKEARFRRLAEARVNKIISMLRLLGNLSDRDYETYMDLFKLMMSLVKAPDLLIYLRSSVPHLVSQIQKRGREYEKSIELDYLEGLNNRYEQWISEYPGRVLTIDAAVQPGFQSH